MPSRTVSKPLPPKPEVRVAQAAQPKDGWQPVGKAFEGRKRPDGINKEWC